MMSEPPLAEMVEPHRLHPAAILVMALRVGRELLFPAILPAAFWVTRVGRSALSIEGLLFVLASMLLFVAVTATYGLLAWRRFTYRVEAGELCVEHGVVTRRRRSIPLERIQTVDVAQGLMQLALGIVSVRVETASGSSQGSDVFLPGVGREDAAYLQRALVVDRRAAALPTTETAPLPDRPVRRLTTGELLLAGSTAGRVGVALSIVLSAVTFADELVPWDTLARFTSSGSGALFLAALVSGILGGTWLLGVLGTILAHARFTLTRDADHLVIERGLLERRRATIPLARVQAVRIVEGVVRQPLGLVELRVESAGYGRQAGESTVLFPLLRLEDVGPLLQTMAPELAATASLAPLPPRARGRYATRLPMMAGLFGAPIVVPVAGLTLWRGTEMRDLLPILLATLAALAAFAMLGVWQYRDTGWSVGDGMLRLRTRGFNRETVLVPRRRIQLVSVSQNPFQRRARLATLTVRVASGSGGTTFSLRHVEAEDAARMLTWVAAPRNRQQRRAATDERGRRAASNTVTDGRKSGQI